MMKAKLHLLKLVKIKYSGSWFLNNPSKYLNKICSLETFIWQLNYKFCYYQVIKLFNLISISRA